MGDRENLTGVVAARIKMLHLKPMDIYIDRHFPLLLKKTNKQPCTHESVQQNITVNTPPQVNTSTSDSSREG